jgi:hypothetical protein
MAEIGIQLQPDRSPTMDFAAVVARLAALDASASVSRGVDGIPYINIHISPPDAVGLWREIRGQLNAEPNLARAAIVTCQGCHGWDDYLLLHHFDRTLILDQLEE